MRTTWSFIYFSIKWLFLLFFFLNKILSLLWDYNPSLLSEINVIATQVFILPIYIVNSSSLMPSWIRNSQVLFRNAKLWNTERVLWSIVDVTRWCLRSGRCPSEKSDGILRLKVLAKQVVRSPDSANGRSWPSGREAADRFPTKRLRWTSSQVKWISSTIRPYNHCKRSRRKCWLSDLNSWRPIGQSWRR